MRGLRDGDTGLWSRPVASQQLDDAYAAAHNLPNPPGSPERARHDASARIKRWVQCTLALSPVTITWEASGGSLQIHVGEAHAAAYGSPEQADPKLLHRSCGLGLPIIIIHLALLLYDSSIAAP